MMLYGRFSPEFGLTVVTFSFSRNRGEHGSRCCVVSVLGPAVENPRSLAVEGLVRSRDLSELLGVGSQVRIDVCEPRRLSGAG